VQLGLIGAGNMASALARGIGEPALVADIDQAKALALAEELGGEAVGSNAELAERADAIVLCHKPQQLDEVAEQVGGQARTVISILGATPIAEIERAYPGAAVYRFIPNIPAELRQGVLCYVPGTRAQDGPEREVLELMSCGPAFMALVAESFADAGAAHGLAPGEALRMTVETMAGTAAYLRAHDYDTGAVKARVATPGGATERGLVALEQGGLADVCRAAVDAVVEGTRR
jgi:pyrroline-5-carboxylate reductase